MFSDFWAPDHKNTMPLKPVFVPEKLAGGNEPLLAWFYDGGQITAEGEADPNNPPHFRISRELMGRVIHTLRQEYISDDEHGRMSKEFKEYAKEALTPLETTLVDSAARLENNLKASMDQHEKFVKDTHDGLVEASEKFKDALTKQVRWMEQHIDKHEVMKESTEPLAISATKQFRRIILGDEMADGSFDLESSRRARESNGKLFWKWSLSAPTQKARKSKTGGLKSSENSTRRPSAWKRNVSSSRRRGTNTKILFPLMPPRVSREARNKSKREQKPLNWLKIMRNFAE
jgi:hypothetical protein